MHAKRIQGGLGVASGEYTVRDNVSFGSEV